MLRVCAFLACAVLTGFLAPGTSVAGGGDDRDCLELVREGLRRQRVADTATGTVRRVYSVTTIVGNALRSDTTTTGFEIIENRDLQCIRSDSVLNITDSARTVIVDRRSKTLQIIDHGKHRRTVEAQARLRSGFPDTLLQGARVTRCTDTVVDGDRRRHIEFTVAVGMRERFSARAIVLEIDGNGDIRRLVILPPDDAPLKRTEIRVTTIDRNPGDRYDYRTIEEIITDGNGNMRDAYRDYRVIRR